MNSKQAKQIELEKVLAHFDIKPVSRKGAYNMYFSPLRPETKPSFAVYKKTNLWTDFGLGKTGTTIDFIMELKKFDFQQALDYMNLHFSNEVINIIPIETTSYAQREKNYTIKEVKPLENKVLLNYLKRRNINLSIAQKYCKEIYWENANGKEIYAVSFENDSKGYDVRNIYYQGNLLTKDITFIDNKSPEVKIFEGFIDFISYISDNLSDEKNYDYIVLNSVSMGSQLNKENSKLHSILQKYNKIDCYLDNDNPGKECFAIISTYFPNAIDKSNTYDKYKDYNEYLCNKPKRW